MDKIVSFFKKFWHGTDAVEKFLVVAFLLICLFAIVIPVLQAVTDFIRW